MPHFKTTLYYNKNSKNVTKLFKKASEPHSICIYFSFLHRIAHLFTATSHFAHTRANYGCLSVIFQPCNPWERLTG